jgi:hypothetical protein
LMSHFRPLSTDQRSHFTTKVAAKMKILTIQRECFVGELARPAPRCRSCERLRVASQMSLAFGVEIQPLGSIFFIFSAPPFFRHEALTKTREGVVLSTLKMSADDDKGEWWCKRQECGAYNTKEDKNCWKCEISVNPTVQRYIRLVQSWPRNARLLVSRIRKPKQR